MFTSQLRKIDYIPFILPVISVNLVAETKGVSICESILTVYKRNIGLLAVSRALVTYIAIAVQVLNGEWPLCGGRAPRVRIIQTNALLSPVAVWGGG
ncbi:uncharacterized protein IAS62_001794 [Cryptococcus decagattii]|uniref:Uncharacterized protein n=1 Tax=Cryptococcus decagattii TaxID=1859122 RepID=A0ABZ2APS7_9TREE